MKIHKYVTMRFPANHAGRLIFRAPALLEFVLDLEKLPGLGVVALAFNNLNETNVMTLVLGDITRSLCIFMFI